MHSDKYFHYCQRLIAQSETIEEMMLQDQILLQEQRMRILGLYQFLISCGPGNARQSKLCTEVWGSCWKILKSSQLH